jgi:hypothetical protein
MDLVSFVRSLPKHWACAPIYANGVEMPKGGTACGKNPLGRAHYEDLSPEAAALYIERNPETFQAIGVFTGARSKGLVILDVDANLGAVTKKWGKDLEKAPKVTSPKKSAAKFFFYVPQDLWPEVSDISLAASNEGWEVLWGRQGLVGGAYKSGGEYTLEGDLNAVPEAPGWLLARMKESFSQKKGKTAVKGLRDGRWAMRSKEERVAIARSCLSVIQPQGRGSEDLWWRIGAMLHSELPDEEGLNLWREWSLQDAEYADDWADGKDPCLNRWEAGFKDHGGLGIGSLIKLADHYDPERARFKRDGCASVIQEVEAIPISYRKEYLQGEELLKRALSLEETIEDPALLDQAKHLLALESGRRDGSQVDSLLDRHLSFQRNNGGKPADVSNLDDSGFEYLIPGIIPKPWLLLVHADGGTGKSAMAMTICKHVSQGKPFNIHGAMVDVPAGRCLWLNGDQNERITKRQFNLIGVERGVDVVGEWDMQWYKRFCRIQEEHKYDLVVIDSLDGCNDSNPYEENRREYALPLKRLARRNGVGFPACSIIVIHHNNRSGGFRGTSAIRAAVDETWNMRKMETKELAELGVAFNSRVITVEKSRDDREGQRMIFSLMSDYTYRIAPLPEPETRIKGTGPNEYMLDVLKFMRESQKPLSMQDVRDDSPIGGKHRERAIKYAIKRLESQKLIERCDPPKDFKTTGRPRIYYRGVGSAVPGFLKKPLTRGASKNTVSKEQIDCTGTDLTDKPDCLKSDFVQSPDHDSSTGTNEPGTLDKTGLWTNPIVDENDCPATDLTLDTDSQRHRGNSPWQTVKDSWSLWDS